MTEYAVRFRVNSHENTYSILDSDAETAARYKGGLPYRVERNDDYATWIFSTLDAKNHFVSMVWAQEHLRPEPQKDSS